MSLASGTLNRVPRYVAFVRAVMIGREGLHREVLLDIACAAGGERPRSYISTGNLTVDLDDAEVARWTAAAEAGIADVIGRDEEVFVRSIDHLAALARSDPFADPPFADVEERTVSFRYAPAPPPVDLPVWSKRGDVAVFAASATGAELFAVNRMIGGRTAGAGGLVERTLGERVTTRSWTTVERILRQPDA